MALSIAACQTMETHYQGITGCNWIREAVKDLLGASHKALMLADGDLYPEEVEKLRSGMEIMAKHGINGTRSFRVEITMLIGVVSDRLSELPKSSSKHSALADILSKLESIYEYFAGKNLRVDFDEEGTRLLKCFDEIFNRAA